MEEPSRSSPCFPTFGEGVLIVRDTQNFGLSFLLGEIGKTQRMEDNDGGTRNLALSFVCGSVVRRFPGVWDAVGAQLVCF